MFTAVIRSHPDLLDSSFRHVRSLANDFARAFELGFFEPSNLVEPIQVTSRAPELILLEIHADQCHSALLRILWGMCEWARRMEAMPIEWLFAKQNGTVIDLAAIPLPPLVLPDYADLTIVRPAFIGLGEQMIVLMQFLAPLNDPGLTLLESGLAVWSALLHGGLPPEGCQPGESVIGATTGYLITPTTYQWHVEGLAADSVCIDLLLRFLAVHADQLALSSIEIDV